VRALAHASLFSQRVVAKPKELRKLHQLIKRRFLEEFPGERKKLLKEFSRREMLYRHFFQSDTICGKLSRCRSFLSYYAHHPKAFLFRLPWIKKLGSKLRRS
jgi:hypothetical protein